MKVFFTYLIVLLSLLAKSQALMGPELNQVGQIKPDGSVLDESNKLVGKFKSDGLVTNQHSVIIGFVRSDGSIENESRKLLGYVNPDGSVMDADKKVIGSIKDGVVTGANNETIGYAKGVNVKWAAAYFFFLF